MSTLRLTLREPPAQRVDMSPLAIDRIAGKTIAQVKATELTSGNRTVRADSLFEITGDYTAELEIRGGSDRLDRIGEGMTRGRVVVRGDVGAYLGAGMTGGHVEVHGAAGAYAATGMQGGMIHITGRAGDFLAGAIPGDHQGMRGGTVVVAGDAGDRTGDRMRRGMLLIEGGVGDYCASRMVAGTIAVLGKAGAFPGFAMRRGTLLLRHAPDPALPTFSDCGEYALGFLTLLARSWRTLPGKFAGFPDTGLRVRRLMGDRANGGMGEILILV